MSKHKRRINPDHHFSYSYFMKNLLFFFISIVSYLPITAADSWESILESKQGKVTFYRYPNNITISDSRDVLDGIEHDLAEAFIDYINEKYQVEIQIEWVETEGFTEVLTTVKNDSSGAFGASSISITDARKEWLNFTPPYLADIAVLVSHSAIPVALSENDFVTTFQSKTAITMKQTTINDFLDSLIVKFNLDVQKKYVKNSGEVLDAIESSADNFGYIDLPNFLIGIKSHPDLRRQFFYPFKLNGLAFIYPKSSDWDEPVNDYFNSREFAFDKERIITKYLGPDIMDVVDRIGQSAEMGPLQEIVISNKEKEVQYREMLRLAKKEQERMEMNTWLIIIITVITFSLLIVFIQYRIKTHANKRLKKQQQLIEEQNNKLYKLNKEKNDLINLLAHDLRSPLNRILGISQLLKAKNAIPEEYQHLNDLNIESSQRLGELIGKILDVEAIESGSQNLKLEAVNVNMIVESVIREYEGAATKKSIQLKPQLKADQKVKADKHYLLSIVENLVSNAIKFSNRESQIWIMTESLEDQVRVSIKDQGPGMTDEDKESVFVKFQKLSAKPTGGEGSVGLGLSIVKQYTELMDGTVSLESEMGIGSVFHIDLKKFNE